MKRDIRYRLQNAPAVTVVPEGDEGSSVLDVHEGRLLDLSRHGAKLSSATEIPTGNSIHLKLGVPELGLVFQVAGAVCWCKRSDAGDWDDVGPWVMGCALRPGLPHELLDRLAEEGEVNRRFDARFREEVSLSAYWNVGSARELVTLRNYSRGGFCIFSTRQSVPGKRFHLNLKGLEVIIASVQWELEAGDGYLIGCEFLNPRDFERLDADCREARRLALKSGLTAAYAGSPLLDPSSGQP